MKMRSLETALSPWRWVSLSLFNAFLAVLILPGAAFCQALEQAAVHAAPQHYLLALPPAPVGEIAEDVLGETLGLPVTTDDRIKAEMSFRIDGVYTPKALAQELGYRLWNVDVALVDQGGAGLRLIPAQDADAAVRAGASLVSPRMSSEAPKHLPNIAVGNKPTAAVGISGLLVFIVGWGVGVATSALTWTIFMAPRNRIRRDGDQLLRLTATLSNQSPKILSDEDTTT